MDASLYLDYLVSVFDSAKHVGPELFRDCWTEGNDYTVSRPHL